MEDQLGHGTDRDSRVFSRDIARDGSHLHQRSTIRLFVSRQALVRDCARRSQQFVGARSGEIPWKLSC